MMIRKILHRTLIVFLLVGSNALVAAIPPGLNYQGHLTDSSGVPVDGDISMTFRLYDVDAGGIALWTDTRLVQVQQGLFSIELGGASNPFPVNLYDMPLWLGLSVAADAEMTPRRPLTTTAYAFKAADADTLEGSTAAALDQSAHTGDTANPHNVSAAQAGAADAAALNSHTSDTANPHGVTAAQTGAASSTDFASHASSSAAHHIPYTDSAAIAAMGAKSDNNPLHHDRYTDPDAVTAMLAADGAGSTFDADKLDGLEASELIDAAQDEVRTPIDALPISITQPGSYYLTRNLDGSSGGIDIISSEVTLDLSGFTIDGGGHADYGIYAYSSNVRIRNGTVQNFGNAGLFIGSGTRFASLSDIHVRNNGSLGNSYYHTGIYLLGTNNHVERCTAQGNGGYGGIYVRYASKLINNSAYDNGGLYGIYGGPGSYLSGNTSYGNAGTGIYGSTATTLVGNSAYENGSRGFYAGSGSVIIGNNASYNSGPGIYATSGSVVANNTAYNNSDSGIVASHGTRITGNAAYNNANWGIDASGSNLVENNTIQHNNTSQAAGQGGLRVYYDSRVKGNMLDSNFQNSIYVQGGENTIEDNTLLDSGNGILFNYSGNFYGNNKAANHTTDYNLNGTVQTTNVYMPNISF